ncbi:TPA: hypothetical protein DEO28_00780 [Candidatus Dependentiae bacterium]|nr:MAG: hypothetical protein UR14_C0003G0008 [candidate division TM6 bacterium GW2011_GWE2_31_21]KKP54128.1 MAG: hypothetical protein UR43_C0001G0146 [candidate division TM6 bacterium GW2011_GWF2_33_332]HBS47849.1 hypothetical protein [Candidatus Dependentiae bacterium]HBZ73034.1 hypothetical protein [Candidatus Dependentiae bacterium]
MKKFFLFLIFLTSTNNCHAGGFLSKSIEEKAQTLVADLIYQREAQEILNTYKNSPIFLQIVCNELRFLINHIKESNDKCARKELFEQKLNPQFHEIVLAYPASSNTHLMLFINKDITYKIQFLFEQELKETLGQMPSSFIYFNPGNPQVVLINLQISKQDKEQILLKVASHFLEILQNKILNIRV